ncbi:MAG: hypothetical protein V4538_02040 [Bacteroidota bacterium]
MTDIITKTKTSIELPTFNGGFNQKNLKEHINNLKPDVLKDEAALAEQLTIIIDKFHLEQVHFSECEVLGHEYLWNEKGEFTFNVRINFKGSIELFQYYDDKLRKEKISKNPHGKEPNNLKIYQPDDNKTIIFNFKIDSLNNNLDLNRKIEDTLFYTKELINANNQKVEDYNKEISYQIKLMLYDYQKIILRLYNMTTD